MKKEEKKIIPQIVDLTSFDIVDDLEKPDIEESKSDILSLPSKSSEDFIGFSDMPMHIMNAINDNDHDEIHHIPNMFIPNISKPQGSGFVSVEMSIGESNTLYKVDLCIDTGADFTIMNTAFIKAYFGNQALDHLIHPGKLPVLKSATGHKLEMMGVIESIIHFGEYKMAVPVLVHDESIPIFLLGSDVIYGRLVIDRGMFLSFPDDKYPPIPINYELVQRMVKSVDQCQIAPRSSAIIKVNVTDNARITGKEVLLTPVTHCVKKIHPYKGTTFMEDESPIRNTVSIIDSDGNSFVLVENDTDDILTILPDYEIAQAELIHDKEGNVNLVNYEIDQEKTESLSKDGKWPINALKNELHDKIPSNVIVQWDKLELQNKNCDEDDSTLVNEHKAYYVHDKEERKHLLDGTGEGFPVPPAADSIHPDEIIDPDPEAWLKNVEHEHLSDTDWEKLKAVLINNKEAFAKSKTEIGCCNYFKVDLPLKPGTGYLYNKPRPLPFKHREMAAETISELLAKGVIRPSNSPHATNIVCVKKKTMNGVISHRICCDLRQVNENSVPNRFPNYWIEDAMAKIQGAEFRTAMDFKDAFHMLVLTEESIPVTAFYFNNVLFEYVRVPFGHVCAMNAFCCLMALLCVGYEPSSYYADDLMITTKTDHKSSRDQLYELHLEHINGMLERIIEAGLKLTAHKCQWCYGADKPMEWLGFTMENNLLKPQESKVKAMKEFPIPSSGKQVISFVSTASFYRRFIKGFAKEVQPLFSIAYDDPFVWTPEAQIAFDKVKEIMCSDLVLRLPRQGEPFQIYSDASAGALGVVLCQLDPIDNKSHPCAYGSRKFNASELKLSIPCKELLAIVYGLNLWSFYICGNPIQVFSDCRAWTFLKMQSGNSGKVSRLALLVSEYDISISYVKGVLNKAADGLSRAHDDGLTKYDDQVTARHPALELLQAPEMKEGEIIKLSEYLTQCEDYLSKHWPLVLKEYESKLIAEGKTPDMECFKANVDDKSQKLSNIEKDALSEAEYVNQVVTDAAILHIDKSKSATWSQRFGKGKIYPFQTNDDYISEGFETVNTDDIDLLESEDESKEALDLETTDSSFKAACFNIRLIAINESCFSIEAFVQLQIEDEFCYSKRELIKIKNKRTSESGYFLKRNILMRKMHTKDAQFYNVICVPRIIVKPLLESTHRSLLSGHFGSSRYLLNLKRKYYWPRMSDEIMDFHNSCLPCQYNDKYPIRYSSGFVIRPLWPMHIVHCDLIVGLPKALDGSYAILLLYDGFSRMTFGIPLSSEKADYVVKKLMSHFVAAFGLPWALHSDNGRNVDGALIRHLSLMLGVLKTSTPPYTPNANPTETMCGAVSMLIRKALSGSDRRYWSLCLPFVLNALNSTVHTATGYSPNSLFFGKYREREPVPLIPFDSESANVNEYYQKMRRFQELAFQIVRSRNERKLQARKESWDSTAKYHSYKAGDFVLVKNNGPASGPGKMKLRAKYLGPFRVIKAYTSSLIVVPWTENSRLDEYYKDPNIFRLIHRGDIRPFYTRQVSVKHCKPFKGKIDSEQIIDPIMLDRFLSAMGIDSRDEVISQIDSHPPQRRGAGSDSDNDDDPGPGPPRNPTNSSNDSDSSAPTEDSVSVSNDSNAPQIIPEPDIVIEPMAEPFQNLEIQGAGRGPILEPPRHRRMRFQRPTAVDRLVDGLRISNYAKIKLKGYYKRNEDLDAMNAVAGNYHNKIEELERLVRHPDRKIREKAELELTEVMDMIGDDMTQADNESPIPSLPRDSDSESYDSDVTDTSAESRTASIASLPIMEDIEEDIILNNPIVDDQQELYWNDDEEIQPIVEPQPDPIIQPQPQEINIRTPDMQIQIRPNVPPTLQGRRSMSRTHSGFSQRDMRQWLDQLSPERRETLYQPRTTRSGRVSNPPRRYSETFEEEREQELRENAREAELLRFEQRQTRARTRALSSRRSIPATLVEDNPQPSTSRGPPTARGAPSATGTRPKTHRNSEPSQRTKSTKSKR